MATELSAESLRLVLDTNVLVAAAFRPHGAAAAIVARARAGELLVVWNAATRRESERIVRRIPPIAASRVLEVFMPAGELTEVVDESAFRFISDPDDRKFAALACATQATLLTQDAHLLSERERLSCRVMTPHECDRHLRHAC